VTGTGVPVSPAKERGEAIECRQRQFSTRSTSRSDLQTNSPGDKWGICKSKQNKHNTTINKCWSHVGAVITVTYGPERDKTNNTKDRSTHHLKSYNYTFYSRFYV
jgi:hypothetical protein